MNKFKWSCRFTIDSALMWGFLAGAGLVPPTYLRMRRSGRAQGPPQNAHRRMGRGKARSSRDLPKPINPKRSKMIGFGLWLMGFAIARRETRVNALMRLNPSYDPYIVKLSCVEGWNISSGVTKRGDKPSE